MEDILRQLGGLLLGAIPTILLFLVLLAAYRFILHKPLEHTLVERHNRTQGAIEKARADIAAAEAKTAEYEHAIQDARMKLFRLQEQSRKDALAARAAAVAEARARAEEQVKVAKMAIQQDVDASKSALHAEAERMANQVIQAVLKQASAAPTAGGAR